MSPVLRRNNVHVLNADAGRPLVFVHGYGCDQNMWRFLAPHFADDRTVVLLDLVGSGSSDLAAYDSARHATLHGYARDIVEVLDELALPPVAFVGHSVSAMIGLLAELQAPRHFRAQVMVAPSPCYIDDDGYTGGFSRADIESLLDTLESNFLGWSSNMAPVIMGAPDRPELAVELTNSFCRTDPRIAREFARATFLSDHRADLPLLRSPALILQCSDDLIAPLAVGRYMAEHIPDATLRIIDNVGHCPHLSAPGPSGQAIAEFLEGTDRDGRPAA